MAVVMDVTLFAMLAGVALGIVFQRSLFAAAMMLGVFSVLSFAIYVTLDAVDVAFTEATVGAGLTTVLFLVALSRTGQAEKRHAPALLPLLVVVVTGALLVYATLGLPPVGDPNAPIHGYLSPGYLEGAYKDIGVPNVVTAVLASYRGYDTLGEVTVVFTAAVAVWLLLGGALGRRGGKSR